MLVLKENQMFLYSIANAMPGEFPIHVSEFAKTSKGFRTIIGWNETEAWEVNIEWKVK